MKVRELHTGGKILVTTLLCPKQTTKEALKALYRDRWHVELDLRNIKTTLGMETLSCRTPEMAQKEIWVYLLAYNLIRLLMAQSALLAEMLPRQLSFKHTLQIWMLGDKRHREQRRGTGRAVRPDRPATCRKSARAHRAQSRQTTTQAVPPNHQTSAYAGKEIPIMATQKSLSKCHSSLTDFTQRSANALKFGLRAGSGSVLTSPDSMIVRND